MLSIQAIIFDCDGTLVDSEKASIDVIREQAIAAGVPVTAEQSYRLFRGRPMVQCVAWVASQLDHVNEAFHDTFTDIVRVEQAKRFRESLGVITGAPELLAALTLPFCVATNGPREKAELTLGLTGMLDKFENRLFSAYEVGSFKPDPGLFLHAANALDVDPRHCLVVEDSLPGIHAGIGAGMQIASLYPSEALPVDLRGAVTSIRDLRGLHQWLLTRGEI